MHRSLTLLFGVAIGPLVGCSISNQAARPAYAWASSETHTPFYREDGEGPFDPPWPAVAVAARSFDSEWEGTLFLMAGSALTTDNAIVSMADSTRLALPFRMAGIQGRWSKLVPNNAEYFIVAFHSGGSGGVRVIVFGRDWWYEGNQQVHSFRPVLDRISCLTPYLADIGKDRTLEILVSAEESGDPANGEPMVYEVFTVDGDALQSVNRLSATEVDQLPGRQALWLARRKVDGDESTKSRMR